ncbi:TetR/AcrR family transcriptional regulator [Rhodococcus sp. IEGM 1318]|uniref:TetR/AcrR family transcriptional regulator n=1 Tax=Rhodococcus sp. IEGM 1318 TaxID=3082226 RepID=UPI002955A30B|nr:TetR/AcrR family transcriptional regulator [Rhodococcus sp. IEGM 1318]MDV8009456.1 TetR/AcrR family transcriptional regulator [Rhodococcus sp. IEGM 1318]
MARPARPPDPARTRALLEAAGTAFATHGYERASLNMILTQAHFPKSSFYHFFGDKAGLLERVVESAIEALTMSVTPPNLELLDAPTFWPKMRELAEQLLEAARSEPLALIAGRLFHCTDTPHSSAMETFRLSATAWLERALERGRELEQIDSETPIDLQRQILVAVVMEIDRWVLAHSSDANPATVAFLVVERLLAPASGRRS